VPCVGTRVGVNRLSHSGSQVGTGRVRSLPAKQHTPKCAHLGTHYRPHTTLDMATQVVTAIEARLTIIVSTAEQIVEAQPSMVPRVVL
jgi:hypothetical protein